METIKCDHYRIYHNMDGDNEHVIITIGFYKIYIE